jgi:hypothetical protein
MKELALMQPLNVEQTTEANKNLLALLELALPFAGVDDLRRYLNAVLIRNVGTDCHIVAANGHILAKIVIRDFNHSLGYERVTTQSIKDAVKVKNVVMLQECSETKDQNYPEYNRLIPEPMDKPDSLPAFNCLYLSIMGTAYSKAFNKLWGKRDKFAGLQMKTASQHNGNLFEAEMAANITAQFVIMPMRL